jgi:hypothetical protein
MAKSHWRSSHQIAIDANAVATPGGQRFSQATRGPNCACRWRCAPTRASLTDGRDSVFDNVGRWGLAI